MLLMNSLYLPIGYISTTHDKHQNLPFMCHQCEQITVNLILNTWDLKFGIL